MVGEDFPAEEQPSEGATSHEDKPVPERRGFKDDQVRAREAGHKGGNVSSGEFDIEIEGDEGNQ